MFLNLMTGGNPAMGMIAFGRADEGDAGSRSSSRSSRSSSSGSSSRSSGRSRGSSGGGWGGSSSRSSRSADGSRGRGGSRDDTSGSTSFEASSRNSGSKSKGSSGFDRASGRSRSGFDISGKAGKSNGRQQSGSKRTGRGLGIGIIGATSTQSDTDPTAGRKEYEDSLRAAGRRSLGGKGVDPRAGRKEAADSMRKSGLQNLSGASKSTKNPHAKALLDTIAGPESAGKYDVRYPGKTFESFDDHPRTPETITEGPHRGKKSTAAGKYQFIERTWDNQAKKLDLENFKPENQDRAAWDLAQTEYEAKTGRNLLNDLRSHDPKVLSGVADALSGQWASLPSGATPAISGSSFADKFSANYDKNMDDLAGTDRDNERKSNEFLNSEKFAQQDPSAPAIDEEADVLTSPRFSHANPSLPGVDDVTTPATGFGSEPGSTFGSDDGDLEQNQDSVEPTQRGLGGRIVAGAIDVGAGIVPVVGGPATAFNLGASLTGNRTIGERVVDAFGNMGRNEVSSDFYDRKTGEGADQYSSILPNQTTQPQAVLPKRQEAAELFEQQFLRPWSDNVERPTPSEKWDGRFS